MTPPRCNSKSNIILGPRILGRSTTLLSKDEKQPYYLFERKTPSAINRLDLILHPEGDLNASRSRLYNDTTNTSPYSINVSIYTGPDIEVSATWMTFPRFDGQKYQSPLLTYWLGEIIADYNSRGLNRITYHRRGSERGIDFDIRNSGADWGSTNTSVSDRISLRRNKERSLWQLTITDLSKRKTVLTIPSQVDTDLWFNYLNTPDLSWRHLDHQCPIKLRVLYPRLRENSN